MTKRFSCRSILAALVLFFSLVAISGCKEAIDSLSPLSVAYNGNGNDSGEPPVDAHIYQQGDSVVVLSQGSMGKAGYTFDGWAESSSAARIAYAAGSTFQMPANSITLFAVWTPKDARPTTAQPGSTEPSGDQPATTQPGSTEPSGDQPATTQPAASCTVSFSTDGGSSVAAQTVPAGQKAACPANPTKGGYAFGGWFRDQALTTAWNFDSDAVSASMTLYAKWAAVAPVTPKYTVTYNGNGSDSGSVPVDANQYESGSMASVLGQGTLARAGYKFLGWTKSTTSTVTYNAGNSIKMDQSISLYASWKKIQLYQVSYGSPKLDSGSVPVDNASYQEGDKITLATYGTMRMTGYGFAYWKDTKSGNTYLPGATITCGAANISLWAIWKEVCSVKYVADYKFKSGGAPRDLDRYYEGSDVTIKGINRNNLVDPDKYTFVGWSTESGSDTAEYYAGETVEMPSGGLTLYPVWILTASL